MKYIVVIPDGGADDEIAEYDGKTALEIAATPTFDLMAREGRLGQAGTVPDGMHPGSDVANLSLLGYDPREGYTGRAALEAASLGVEVPDGDAVFRANLVTVTENQLMDDYSAGHISTEEGMELIEQLDRELNIDGVKLYPGVGYRHLCLMENAGSSVPECTPPHDIMGEVISEHLPQGQFSSWVLEIERTSAQLLPKYGVNRRRVAEGNKPATQVWLWGGATAMSIPCFTARFGIASAGLISAVDLMQGMGRLAGMDVISVKGANAYYDTNFAGKGRAALDYIYLHDLVVVHVEAPDEAGHNGDIKAKAKALEDIDRHIMAPIYSMARYYGDWRIMIAPDHPTPVASRVHNSNPVPYVLWGPGFEANGARAFNEKEAARVGGDVIAGTRLMVALIGAEPKEALPAPRSVTRIMTKEGPETVALPEVKPATAAMADDQEPVTELELSGGVDPEAAPEGFNALLEAAESLGAPADSSEAEPEDVPDSEVAKAPGNTDVFETPDLSGTPPAGSVEELMEELEQVLTSENRAPSLADAIADDLIEGGSVEPPAEDSGEK